MRNSRVSLQFIDDLAKMATGALGSFGDVRQQVRKLVKEHMKEVHSKMDLVTREEYARVEAMAEKARDRQEELSERVEALEKLLKQKPTLKRKKK